LALILTGASPSRAATVTVAASNSSREARERADFLCGGEGDEKQINAAIRSLPDVGGTVLLAEGTGDPNVSHDRFEFCGIKAYYQAPGGPGGTPNHHITISDCHVLNAHRLGIMLEGPYMKVVDNVLGNAGSDSVEILTGPGIISRNQVIITGRTHVAIGTDRADNIIMSHNLVHIRKGGDLDIGFRSWAQSQRHVIEGNILTVEEGGACRKAMDIRGLGATVIGNSIYTWNPEEPTSLCITAGHALVHGNLLENVRIEVSEEARNSVVVRENLIKGKP